MKLRRFLSPEGIRLEMRTRARPQGDIPEDFDPEDERNLDRVREEVIREMAELFATSGAAANENRLFRDLHNREKKASTAIGSGIVLPHVRTAQVRRFVMVFGRAVEDLPYRSPDREPVRLFFGLAAPPYDDRTYLKVYKTLAETLLDPVHYREFLTVEESSQVLRVLELVS